MALTTAQQALLLFKKWLGLGQTTASREFFNETSYPGRSAVYTSQIWTQADRIPTTAPVLSSSVASGVVQYWQDITLGSAPGTTNAFTSSLLIDAIPFNFGDGTSYNYTLKDSTNASIAFGQGDWIVDTDSGLVTFYSTVPANMPPKISFYKYVGAKGFTSASVSLTGSLAGTASVAISSSFATSASFAPTILPAGVVSSSTQVNTGSFTGSFTGTFVGTSSWASNVISSSYATTASYFDSFVTFPNGLTVTGSVLATGGFTGSLTGSATTSVSSSYALTASYVSGSTGASISSSYALTASYVQNAVTASYFSGSISFPAGLQVTGSLVVSGSITGSLLGTASLALNNIVTASAAASTITFTKGDGSQFSVTIAQSGSVESSSYATYAASAGTATSASYASTSSVATSASYAPTILPSGVVSSSLQINTGSFSGSFTGTLVGTSSWASNVISSSFATTAITASYISGGVSFPAGLDITGSLNVSGSITGSLLGTASIATELVKQTITMSSSISPSFTTITSGSQHLTNGVYAITSVLNSVSLTNYRIAGTFAWHTGSVSTTDIDEIFLHRTGQSASSASIFMRTNAISGSTTFLEIGSDYALATGSYNFTVVKMI